MNEFDKKRSGTGTAEWAEVTENICRGCSNNCLYCYAAHNANRFKLRDRKDWEMEEFTKRASMTSYPARKGVIMFPSSHDITPFNVDQYIRVARLMLEKGNRLLIVSKPRMECIEKICAEFQEFREQILFRFTIGTYLDNWSKAWEPGAPLPGERFDCLDFAFIDGFSTSVSIEPIVGGADVAIFLVKHCAPSVTDTIWIGKMNKLRLRVPNEFKEQIAVIENLQRDEEIMRMHGELKSNPLVRWKDSVNDVVARHSARL